MTSFETTAGNVGTRPASPSRTRLRPGTALRPIALAAAVLTGIVLGAVAGLVVPSLTTDPVSEHVRLLEFAEQLQEAAWRDHLWALSHP